MDIKDYDDYKIDLEREEMILQQEIKKCKERLKKVKLLIKLINKEYEKQRTNIYRKI
jgi:hypothetical protein